MLQTLTSAVVVAWSRECVRGLADARDRLNAANVFPVADSDTGTNLWLTACGGAEALGRAGVPTVVSSERFSPDDVLRIIASGMLDGARGNSGVILSEYVRGFAAGVSGAERGAEHGIEAEQVCAGLERAAVQAVAAVGVPAPGTILTAAEQAAIAARDALTTIPDATLDDVIAAAIFGIRLAIGNSPHELSVLRDAHVVDAGALGLLIVLESLQRALSGIADQALPEVHAEAESWGITDLHGASESCAEPGGEFEVMFAASRVLPPGAEPHGISQLRTDLAKIGDSVVVVEAHENPPTAPSQTDLATEHARVHVHTADPAVALVVAAQWTIRHAVVHSVAAPRYERMWAVLGITNSPGLLAEIARTGGVGLWAQSGIVSDDELRRALIDTKSERVMVLRGRLTDDPSVADRVKAIAGDLGVSVTVSPRSSDAQLAVGLVAAVLCDPGSATGELNRGAQDCLTEIETSVAGVQVIDVEVVHGTSLVAVVDTALVDTALAGKSSGAQQLTVIWDDDVPAREIEALSANAARWGVDVIDVRSGVPGLSCQLGFE